MEKNDGFNVMDMAADYAAANNMNVSDLFKKPEPAPAEKDTGSITPITKKEKQPWVPDASLTEGMDELSGAPVTYDKSEIKESGDDHLENMFDEDVKNDSLNSMNEMARMTANIEEAKERFGIAKLRIPEGEYQVLVYNAAGDTDHKRAQEGLDEIFQMFIDKFPEFILEWSDKANVPADDTTETKAAEEATTGDKIINIPHKAEPTPEPPAEAVTTDTTPAVDQDTVKVVIDKTNVSNISWSKDDAEKIRRSRAVELTIVESGNLEFSDIVDADANAVDDVIAKYVRKNNDIVVALPASRYRCTVTGLSYPEVMDLSNSNEMNTIDGERKKWSIAFDHIKNPSIGPWKKYRWYINPETKKKEVMDYYDTTIPNGLTKEDIQIVTEFDDFLMKTSFMDLEFILWKVLCATSMETEVISIDCHAKISSSGTECGETYDWIYSPNDLLRTDLIDPAVLEEMKVTATVETSEDIMKNYRESLLMKKSSVKLPHSGMYLVFGHISAYDYLDSIYGEIKALEDAAENDPSAVTKGLNYAALSAVKEILVPNEGKLIRITGTDKLFNIIKNLDEVDWPVVGEIVGMVTEPYQFTYSMCGITCPRCKNKSNIAIDSMTRLIFIVAQSLSSVQVTFKNN